MKRIFDIVLVLFSIPILIPIYILVALMVRFKFGSPVLFKQPRPGLNEKVFNMIKFSFIYYPYIINVTVKT